MDSRQRAAMFRVLSEVEAERHRQHAAHGEQSLPRGGLREAVLLEMLDGARYVQEIRGATWATVLAEEFCEAMLAGSPAELRAELVQVAAVAVQWVEALDREAGAVDARRVAAMLAGREPGPLTGCLCTRCEKGRQTQHAPRQRTNGTEADAGQGAAAFVAPAGSWDASGSWVAGAPPSPEAHE